MTPAHATGPRQALLPAPLLLPGLFETFTADHHRPRGWHQVPLNVRGDLRAIWVCVRAGQTDPWLAALAGWRHRATWHRRTYRSATATPDYDDLDSWAGDRAATGQTGREIAGQYLALARHLITAGTGTGPAATTTTTDRPEDASSAVPATTHLLHLGNETVTAPVLAGQRPAPAAAGSAFGLVAATVPPGPSGVGDVVWPGPWWRPGQPWTPPPQGAVGSGLAWTDRFLEYLVQGVLPVMPGVVWLRGLPGAGKTTWAEGWVERLQSAGVPATVYGRDRIRAILRRTLAPHVPVAERDVTTIVWARLPYAFAEDGLVLMDDLNLHHRWLRVDQERARKAGARWLAIADFRDVPVQVCISRDATRPLPERAGQDRIRELAVRYRLPADLATAPARLQVAPAAVQR